METSSERRNKCIYICEIDARIEREQKNERKKEKNKNKFDILRIIKLEWSQTCVRAFSFSLIINIYIVQYCRCFCRSFLRFFLSLSSLLVAGRKFFEMRRRSRRKKRKKTARSRQKTHIIKLRMIRYICRSRRSFMFYSNSGLLSSLLEREKKKKKKMFRLVVCLGSIGNFRQLDEEIC